MNTAQLQRKVCSENKVGRKNARKENDCVKKVGREQRKNSQQPLQQIISEAKKVLLWL